MGWTIARKRQRARGLPSRFEKGNIGLLRHISNDAAEQYRFTYDVWIVQTGVSKQAITQPMLQLLGFVEELLIEHRHLTPVILNK